MKWSLCILLFLATTLNYLDRQTLAILAPAIREEFHLDNESLGILFSVFYYAYTLAQFAIGRVLDRTNLRWAYGFAVLAWSLVAASTSLAVGFASLVAFRLLLGVAESPNWPAAMRIVAVTLKPHERSLGNGIFTSGTSIGALIAPAIILGVSSLFGWRAAFAAVGSTGLIWFAVWVVATRKFECPPAAPSKASADYRAILSSPQFWRVLAVSCLINPCLYFNLNWLPTYFSQRFAVTSAKQMTGILTLIYIGLDLGYLLCGVSALLLVRLGLTVQSARRAAFLLATLLLGLSAMVPLANSIATASWLLAVVNIGAGMWICMYLTMAQEVSPGQVSTAAGLLGGSGSLAGAFAMWGVGWITKETGGFAVPLTAIALAGLLAAAAGWTVTKPESPFEKSNP